MRILLWPFSLIYGFMVTLRNGFYRQGLFKEQAFGFPIIGIGNLRVGGTGKTPMIETVLGLLKDKYTIAMLSRGYGRKSSGFVLSELDATAARIGDEPAQVKSKFPEVHVAVDADRVAGVNQLTQTIENLDVVVLDDVYQHRAIKPGLLILLTAYNDLYIDDAVLPMGRLREPKFGAHRADFIVVTKCPLDLSAFDKRAIMERLQPKLHQRVLFSGQAYGAAYEITQTKKDHTKFKKMLLITGIVDASFLKEFLEKSFELIHHFEFPDHHWFKETDLTQIKQQFSKLSSDDTVIFTTEKDAQRLKPLLQNEKFADLPIFAVPMSVRFLGRDEEEFNQAIHEHIRSYH